MQCDMQQVWNIRRLESKPKAHTHTETQSCTQSERTVDQRTRPFLCQRPRTRAAASPGTKGPNKPRQGRATSPANIGVPKAYRHPEPAPYTQLPEPGDRIFSDAETGALPDLKDNRNVWWYRRQWQWPPQGCELNLWHRSDRAERLDETSELPRILGLYARPRSYAIHNTRKARLRMESTGMITRAKKFRQRPRNTCNM